MAMPPDYQPELNCDHFQSAELPAITDRLRPVVRDLIRQHGERAVIVALLLSAADLCHQSTIQHDDAELASMFQMAAEGGDDPSYATPDAPSALLRVIGIFP